MLEITTLGDLSVRLNGETVTGLASRKAEALLVYLAVTRQAQPRDFLGALLWEEEQERSLGNLRVVLSSLRKALKGYIDIQRDKVGLIPGANISVDVLDLLDTDPIPPDLPACSQLKEALNLYQGSFLLGFNIRNAAMFENWVTLERQHFRTVFDNKFQALLECLLDNAQWQDAIEWGENWIARTRQGYAPETAFRAVMRAYAGMGDLTGLSSAYQRCIHYLGEELGMDPSEQTQQLYVQLLAGRKKAEEEPKVDTAAISAAHVVLNRWRDSSVEHLDLAGLSLVYASLKDLELSQVDANLILGSALHHGLDVRTWVRQIDAPEKAVNALEAYLAEDGQAYTRIQIIDALKELPGEAAGKILADMAMHDRNAEVRGEAALAVLARGEGEELTAQLTAELGEQGNTAVIPPLVALVDETGEMPRLDFYPRLMVWMGVVRRRWRKHRDAARSMVWRGTIMAAIVSLLHGSTAPLQMYLFSRADYLEGLQTWSLPYWALMGAAGYLFIGGAQGLVTGFALSAVDALSAPRNRRIWRVAVGGVSGLLYAVLVVWFAAAEATGQTANPGVFIPVLIVYGLLFGAGLSFIYPEMGILRARREQLLRALWVTLGLMVVTALQIVPLYREETLEVLPNRFAFLILFIFGLALVFSKNGEVKKN